MGGRMQRFQTSKIRNKAFTAIIGFAVITVVLSVVSIYGLIRASHSFESLARRLDASDPQTGRDALMLTVDAAQNSSSQALIVMIVLSLVGLLAIAFISYHLLSFANVIGRVSEALVTAASGDLDQRITHITGSDEAVEIQVNVNRLLDRTEAFMREASATMKAAADGRYHRKIAETGMLRDYLKTSRGINESIDVMGTKITAFSSMTDDFEHKVVDAVKTVSDSAEHIETIANNMSHNLDTSGSRSLDVTEAASLAKDNVQSVSQAAGELSSSIRDISQQIAASSQITLEAVEDASKANTKIQDLANAAHQIREVVNLINDIAEQTNLLALNATIEAARAGEHGKGFAVVATEVKNLASQVGKATEQISRQITGIQDESSAAVDAIETITGTIGRVNEITGRLAAAVEEQNAATEDIARNVDNVLENMDVVSDSVSKVSRHLIESYGAGIRVLWAAKDIHAPISMVNEQTSTYLSSARSV